ncbi:MAG: glycosyltransferase family 2 protein [Clostridia bacterium]|nr:glycosyltransferase family 2 protein [Clostridia bacterium]
MTYLEIVGFVGSLLSGLIGLISLHFAIFTVAGIFLKKKFPKAKEKCRFGIVVAARNEETVIGNLIESVFVNGYDKDLLEVFVAAHNCTDGTARAARERGATVYEYNDSEKCTKGYALHHLFEQIRREGKMERFDGFIILDADNILGKDYISNMNDAFVYYGKKHTVTSFRHSKNFGYNTLSAIYGIFWIWGCRMEMRGRCALDCSTRVPGTGFVISRDVANAGWNYVTLTEDWEFSADRIIAGEKIYYCDDAVFYDEQPTDLHIMWRQRVRWARGHLIVFTTRAKALLRALFTPKKQGGSRCKGSAYDMLSNIFPAVLLTTAIGVLQLVLYLLAPLFGVDGMGAFLGALKNTAVSFVGVYLGTMLMTAAIYFLERERIKGVRIGTKILSVLGYPLFTGINIFCIIAALFSKNLKWKTIPHKDTTTFDDLNRT